MTTENFITEQEVKRQRHDRLSTLGLVLELFWGEQLPPTSDLIAMADWVLTGMPDIAQGNDRITAENYERREPT
jgi:hypothetical protein